MNNNISLILMLSLCFLTSLQAQVAINETNNSPAASAMLDIESTDKGLLAPRMTTAQRTAIASPATGLLVYDNDTNSFWYYNGTTWVNSSDTTDVDWLRSNGTSPTGINQAIYRTGNIGIGAAASNPSFPVDVIGTGGERIRTYTQDGVFAGYVAKNSTREFFMGVQATYETTDASSGFHIYDNTAGSQRFVIDEDGDVGIGQANPNAKLHVNGDFRLVDGTQGVSKILTSDANGFASWVTPTDNVDDADNDPANELITSAILNGTMLEITENGGTSSVELNSLLDEDWTYNSGTADAGEIYHSGQVSIGSNTASFNGGLYRLYSERQSTDGAAIMGYNGTSRGMLGVWDNNFPDVDLPNVQSVGVLGYCPDFANNSRAAIYGYTENTEGTAYAGNFQATGVNAQVNYGIYVNAANSTNDNFSGYFLGEKSYFEGNIGLGTTTPETKLHVNGTILAGAQTTTANTTTLTGNEGIIMPGTTSDYTISVQDGNGRVQHKWNATNGTGETFVVGGEDAAFIDITGDVSTNNDAWLEFKHADGSSAVAGDPISWNSQLMINQGGEVGINESSPDDMLHVTSGGNGTRVRAENSSNGWAGFVSKNTVGEMFIGVQGAFDANPGELHFYDNVAGARRMVIDAAGNVGIGRNNPTVKLDVNGSVNCTGGTCSSDLRWKKGIRPLERALDKVVQMRGVSYDWRTQEFPDRDFSEDRQIGVIAQEVEQIYPELIKTDNEGFKSMDYMSLTAVLLESIKELKEEKDVLAKEVAALKKNNANLTRSVDSMANDLMAIKAMLQSADNNSTTENK